MINVLAKIHGAQWQFGSAVKPCLVKYFKWLLKVIKAKGLAKCTLFLLLDRSRRGKRDVTTTRTGRKTLFPCPGARDCVPELREESLSGCEVLVTVHPRLLNCSFTVQSSRRYLMPFSGPLSSLFVF